MVFPIHLLSVLGLVFCLVNEISLNCTSGLVLLCFFNSLYLLITFFVLHKSRFSRLSPNPIQKVSSIQKLVVDLSILLIAALIFSAGYYSAPIFYFVELFFALPFCRLFDILREIFLDFSRLFSLFSHSAQCAFKQQLLSKAIQNEESQY